MLLTMRQNDIIINNLSEAFFLRKFRNIYLFGNKLPQTPYTQTQTPYTQTQTPYTQTQTPYTQTQTPYTQTPTPYTQTQTPTPYTQTQTPTPIHKHKHKHPKAYRGQYYRNGMIYIRPTLSKADIYIGGGGGIFWNINKRGGGGGGGCPPDLPLKGKSPADIN